MPRLTRRKTLLQQVLNMMEFLMRLMKRYPGDDLIWNMLNELWDIYGDLLKVRYLASRGISAGRHQLDMGEEMLENLIRNYPEPAFLNQFRMHRSSFWALVEFITPRMWLHCLPHELQILTVLEFFEHSSKHFSYLIPCLQSASL